jgi:uncharacterized protein YdaU (DUF1376 family)
MLQDGAYSRLLDACYDREKFPTLAEALEWTWASTTAEVEAVTFILSRFFVLEQDGVYTQNRVREEVEKYRVFCERQKQKGKLGGRPKTKPAETHGNPGGDAEETRGDMKHNPGQTKTSKPVNQKTNKPDKQPSVEPSADDVKDRELALWMFKAIRHVIPKEKEPNFDKWAKTIRLMREQDGHTHRLIAEVFQWANRDGFWATNIRSPDKLRKQFAVLDAKRGNGHEANRQPFAGRPGRSERADESARRRMEEIESAELADDADVAEG